MSALLKRTAIVAGAAFLRRSPFERGRYRLATSLLPWLRELGASMAPRIVRTRYGFLFGADLADWLGQYVYLTGLYEPPTAALFVHLVKPGSTVVDIGANAGFFSLLSAKLVGPKGKVVAFEPIPSVRERLLENIALNGYCQIDVREVAVSDKAGSLTMYEGPAGHKGISSLRPLKQLTSTLVVEVVALDQLAGQIGKIDFIKIDVEGAEMLALFGMRQLLQRDHPYLIIEFTDDLLGSFGHSVSQMAEVLTALGYRLYRVTDDGLFRLDPNGLGLPLQYNVLACREVPAALSGLVIVG